MELHDILLRQATQEAAPPARQHAALTMLLTHGCCDRLWGRAWAVCDGIETV